MNDQILKNAAVKIAADAIIEKLPAVIAVREAAVKIAADAFPFQQGQLAALLGIATEELRKKRRALTEGVHWQRDGQRVMYAEAALVELRKELNLSQASTEGDRSAPPLRGPLPHSLNGGEGGAGARPPGEDAPIAHPMRRVFQLPERMPTAASVTELVVWRVTNNPHIVEAHLAERDPLEDATAIVRVRVRAAENFVRGMAMPVRLAVAPDLYEFTGRLPRWRGKY